MITGMREQYRQVDLLKTFEVSRSSYSYRRDQANQVQPERERLKARVIEIHTHSRQAAGSRTITAILRRENESIGRYKVRRLMKEAGVESKQPSKPHRYKVADKPSKVADNHLNREYTVAQPNRVWCGDVTEANAQRTGERSVA